MPGNWHTFVHCNQNEWVKRSYLGEETMSHELAARALRTALARLAALPFCLFTGPGYRNWILKQDRPEIWELSPQIGAIHLPVGEIKGMSKISVRMIFGAGLNVRTLTSPAWVPQKGLGHSTPLSIACGMRTKWKRWSSKTCSQLPAEVFSSSETPLPMAPGATALSSVCHSETFPRG